jgi:hypothetical protein
MDRILECKVCGKRFQAKRDATTCSARCRKRLSRTMAVVTDEVTLPAPPPVRTGWLPLAAAELPPEPPAPPPKVTVPTSVDMLGHPEDYVACESAEAAILWDVRRWHR